MKRYWLNWLIGLDQWVNTWFKGDPDETISSRMGKSLVKRDGCILCHTLCRWLDYLDRNHCIDAIEWDEGEGR